MIICVLPEVGFEPTHPKIIELKSTALDRSAIQAQNQLVSQSSVDWRTTTAVRFELTRAEPNRFRIYRLNHSAMLPHSIYVVMVMLIQQPTTRRIRTYVQCNTASEVNARTHEAYLNCTKQLSIRIRTMQHIEWSQCTHARSILSEQSN